MDCLVETYLYTEDDQVIEKNIMGLAPVADNDQPTLCSGIEFDELVSQVHKSTNLPEVRINADIWHLLNQGYLKLTDRRTLVRIHLNGNNPFA
jgi:hypothetical protein